MSRKNRIEQQLEQQLEPSFLSIENESNKHHVPEGSETHFKVTAVSESFADLSRIDRHRKINQLLAEELKQGLHALSMHLYTEQEWKKKGQSTTSSPSCKDGFNK